MTKLIILCGISGSGKSTWAKNYVQEKPHCINVERDQLRNMLYGFTDENIKEYYLSSDINIKEKQVTKCENLLIWQGLYTKHTVVVSNTHLKVKYLNKYLEFISEAEIKIIFFNITLKEAIIRDSSRKRQVGEEIITRQYNDYVNLRNFLTKNKLKFDYIAQEIDML